MSSPQQKLQSLPGAKSCLACTARVLPSRTSQIDLTCRPSWAGRVSHQYFGPKRIAHRVFCDRVYELVFNDGGAEPFVERPHVAACLKECKRKAALVDQP